MLDRSKIYLVQVAVFEISVVAPFLVGSSPCNNDIKRKVVRRKQTMGIKSKSSLLIRLLPLFSGPNLLTGLFRLCRSARP